MKNVSTHSMINTSDGELDMKLELEDIGTRLLPYKKDTHTQKRRQRTKIIAAAWGTELIQFLAAQAILHQDNRRI